MDRIKEFDELYKEVDKDWMVVNTLMNCIFMPLLFMVFMLPIDEFVGDNKITLLTSVMVLCVLCSTKLTRYVQIKDNGKVSNIYEKLKYIPISQKDIFMVRLNYLWKECKKCLIVMFVAQMFGAIVYQHISIWNFVYVMVGGLIFFLCGLSCLIPKGLRNIRKFLFWWKGHERIRKSK